jgi:transposase
MANVLSKEKRQEVQALGRLGWTLRQIEAATGVRRETSSKYLKAAGIAIRPERGRRPPSKAASQAVTDPGGDPKAASQAITDSAGDSKAASRAITDSAATAPAAATAPGSAGRPAPSPPPVAQPSTCEPHRAMIEAALSRGRNGMSIYQELVDEHGFAGSYSSVRRFLRRLRGEISRAAHAVIHTEPGEEAQVDYGEGPMVRDPNSGKYRRTRLFVMTLGYSRKCVRLLVWRSSTRIWAELHEQALRRLGGCPRVIVLDNLKEGVLAPDIYDPVLNPLYRDMLSHYGVVALPCRIRHADRKGKVERGVGHAQDTALKGKRFESIELAQAHLDHWEERWADTRIHGTTKRQVAAMFAEEKPHLQALPIEPFRYYDYGTRTVHLDGHVEVQIDDVDLGTGTLFIRHQLQEVSGKLKLTEPKTAAGRRRVTLPKRAQVALSAHFERMRAEGWDGPWVFPDTRGGPLRKSNVRRKSFEPLVVKAKLPRIRFHDLRHTAATLLLREDVHPKVVQERLGHSRIGITLDTYSHAVPSMQQEAADKLDHLFENVERKAKEKETGADSSLSSEDSISKNADWLQLGYRTTGNDVSDVPDESDNSPDSQEEEEWSHVDSNHGPPACEAGALTN